VERDRSRIQCKAACDETAFGYIRPGTYHGSFWKSSGDNPMQDLIFIVATIAFFALSIGYVRFCDRVK
jgi:hypothetical protein